jgi:hypothetical protein
MANSLNSSLVTHLRLSGFSQGTLTLMPPLAKQYDRKQASQQHEYNPITARPPDAVPAKDIKPLLEA